MRFGPVTRPGREGTFIGRVVVEVRPPDKLQLARQQALQNTVHPALLSEMLAEVLRVPVEVPATALHSREAHGSGGEGRRVADLRFRLRLPKGR